MTAQPRGRWARLDLPGKLITAVIGVAIAALLGWLGGPLYDVLTARDPVRVLLAIDISGSVNNELLAGDPRTRIAAAQEWAPRALDSLEERDQLGIATFSTSDPEPQLVVPIRSLTAKQKGEIATGLESLQANTGGTPLHQSIAWGVERLQENWANDTKNTLVVLSDGDEHASDDFFEQERATADAEARLRATDQANMEVRVLGTTVRPAAECDDLKRFYDKCYAVVTDTDLRHTLNAILGELDLPEPKTQSGSG